MKADRHVLVAAEPGRGCTQSSCYSQLRYGLQYFIIKHFLQLSKRHGIVFCIRRGFEALQAKPEEGEQSPST